MARIAVNARAKQDAEPEALGPAAMLALRVAWIALAGLWGILVVSLASFDSADRPSHVVAVHNPEPANLCGRFGAIVAYVSYFVLGIGAWVVLAGIFAYLAAVFTGRRVTHPPIRLIGLLLMALAVSCAHGLLLPATGPLAGAPAGLLATALDIELTARFNTVGTLLIVIAAFAIGSVVAFDRFVLAVPRGVVAAVRSARTLRERWSTFTTNLLSRPRLALSQATASDPGTDTTEAPDEDDDIEWEYVDENGDPIDEDDEDEYEYVGEEEEASPEDGLEGDEAEPSAALEPTRNGRPRLTPEQLRAKIARLPVRVAGSRKTVARDEDIPREESFEGYEFPTLDMLEDPESNFSEKMEQFVRDQAQHLEETLQIYGIDGEVAGIESGPAVTLYSVQLAPGTKVAKISAISSDIARALRAQNIRVVPNMVGKTTIGIEVPNLHREKVRLKELMSGGHARRMILPMFLGKDAAGEPLVADLTRMPHMLIAGTTGSGKSVCMNSIIMSWLYTKRPDELKMVLVDPKMVEMNQFGEIPHLMCPVVTEAARAAAILEWAVERMEERYELFKEARVRDIGSYNKLSEKELYDRLNATTDEEKARIPKKLHYMVFIVDEMADMIMTCKEVEHSIVRIAQKARAVGIHLILATQRPQANVVTGLIKSNMPCRVSFKVSSGMDSRIVLDHKGAELLLGQGDMMFLTPHTSEIRRAQGTLVEDSEIRQVTRFLRDVAMPNFERSLVSLRSARDEEGDDGAGLRAHERDPLFDEAVRIIIESGRGSVSLLQRRLSIGYGRASRLIDQMGLAGIVGDHKGSVAREVLITLEEWEQMKALEEQAELDGTLFEGDRGDEMADDINTAVIETQTDAPVPAEYADEYRA
jgi:S-DNA-T family DNA segregation ATPase FtsK/SpoIIIE